VYLAMQSRGFRGRPHTLDTFKLRARDWTWGAVMIGIAIAAIGLGG
jgi:energy-coupling factor transporter transmembrane protein EcfT